MFLVYVNAIWACIFTACAGAASVLLYFLLCSKGKFSLDDMKPSPKKDLLIGLRDNAPVFSDLYEPLYFLSMGKADKKEQVFDAWLERIEEVEGYNEFKAAFKAKYGNTAAWKGKKGKYVKNARKLLKDAVKAGVKRDKNLFITADEMTAEKYEIVGDEPIESGVTYDVYAPYWFQLIEVPAEEPAEQTEEDADALVEELPEETVSDEDIFEAPEAEEEAEYPDADEVYEDAEADEIGETYEADEADEAVEEILEMASKPTKKEKKAAKKQAKMDKKAEKKAKRAEKKVAVAAEDTVKPQAENVETVEIILCKGIIR